MWGKVIVVDVNNTGKICRAENVYVKSPDRDKIIIVKLKMQKKICAFKILAIIIFRKNILVLVDQDKAHKIYATKYVYDQSSHGHKIITFKQKIQKNLCQ